MDKILGNTNQTIFFIILLPFLVILFLGILYMLKVPRKVRDRNREAENLCKKKNSGAFLSKEEWEKFDEFLENGVILKTIDGNYSLSELAIKELLEVS